MSCMYVPWSTVVFRFFVLFVLPFPLPFPISMNCNQRPVSTACITFFSFLAYISIVCDFKHVFPHGGHGFRSILSFRQRFNHGRTNNRTIGQLAHCLDMGPCRQPKTNRQGALHVHSNTVQKGTQMFRQLRACTRHSVQTHTIHISFGHLSWGEYTTHENTSNEETPRDKKTQKKTNDMRTQYWHEQTHTSRHTRS